MSFREETAALAVDLAHLVTSRSSRTLDPDGLAVALLARRDTLRLMRRILLTATGQPHTHAPRDRTGTGTPPADVSIGYLEDRPVAALLRTLTTIPLPTTRTDDPAATGHYTADTGWPQVRRHTALADHEWSQRPPTPTGHARWSAVADVAAITHALALLDHDLLAATRTHPRPDPDTVDALTRSTISGLRVAALTAGTTAHAGPLPDWQTPGPERHPTRALLVRSPGHIVAAQKRLTALITTADALSPRAITQLADGQARYLTTAAHALARADPTRAQHATVLAAALRNTLRGSPHALASLTPDDPRPLTQTRSLLLAVAVAGTRGWDHPQAHSHLPALARGTDAAADVVTALAQRAHHELNTGQWLIPNDTPGTAGDYTWRHIGAKGWGLDASDTAPRLLTALNAAAALARSLPTPPPVPQPAADRVTTPRQTLATITIPPQERPETPSTSTTSTATPTDQPRLTPNDTAATVPTNPATDTQRPDAPAQRWAALADTLDPRLTHEPDWAATAGALQLVHDHGHDPSTISQHAIAHTPLGEHPAQDLRYRLAPFLDSQATSRPSLGDHSLGELGTSTPSDGAAPSRESIPRSRSVTRDRDAQRDPGAQTSQAPGNPAVRANASQVPR